MTVTNTHRRHKRARALRARQARRFRPAIEPLEDRRMLSTIAWFNRGSTADDRDSFNSVFGTAAEAARQVVDAAIDAWESAIASFNYSDPTLDDTFRLSLSIGAGSLGAVSTISGGKPTSGWVTLDRGWSWFIDPTPYHHEEFLGTLINPYTANPTPGGAADGPADLYSIAIHEIAHSLGLDSNSDLLLQQDPSGYLTNTGLPDFGPSPPVAKLWTFNGPSVKALLTSNNVGTTDAGAPIHVAEAAGGNVVTSGGITYYGVEDTGRPGGWGSQRLLVSNLITQVFKDAYGYTINPPTWNNLHSVLDPATGALHVRGGSLGDAVYPQQFNPSDDTIHVSSFSSLGADYLQADVFVGNPVPGIGPNVTLSSTFLSSDVRSIVIEAGDGDDSITIQIADAAVPLTVNSGDGDDSITIQAADATVPLTVNSGDGDDSIIIQTPDAAVTVIVNAGDGDDEILIYADDRGDVVTVEAGGGADALTVAGTNRDDSFLLRRSAAHPGLVELFVNGLTQINFRSIDTLVATGSPLFGEGHDELVIDFRNGNPLFASHLDFLGGLGDDAMRFTASAFTGADLFSASFVGERGTDRIEATVTGGVDLDLTDDLLEWNDVDRPSVLGSRVILSGVEEGVLTGGSEDNVLDASRFTSGGVTLRGEEGDDHLVGGTNDDTLDGGPGNDTMEGGGGNDTYLEAPGSVDRLIDSAGIDALDFSAATSGIAFDLTKTSAEVQTVDLAGNRIALTGFFERVIGSAFDDRFFWGHTVAGQSILEMLAGAGDDQVIIDGTKALPGTAVSLIGQQGDDRFQIHLPLPGAGGNPPPNPPGDAGVLLSANVDGERLQIVATDHDEDIRVVARPVQGPIPCFDVGVSDAVSQRLIAQITADNVAHFALDAAAGNDRISALLESAGLIAVPIVANFHGGADDDQIFVDTQNSLSSFAWSVLADGGAGNDLLQTLGPTGAILLGGKGMDEVIGGSGRDLLIGGEDRDSITGGDGQDIIIPGLTAFDANPDALRWIHGFWNSDAPFLERVEYLSGPSDAPFHLTFGQSVFDDGADNNVGDHSLDDWLLSPCFVTNTNDSGPGSLREAIECANMAALPTLAVVSFRIPTTDPNFVDVDSHLPGGDSDPDAFVIAPLSELPPLDNVHGFGINLDGRTQTSFGGDTNPFGPEMVLVNGGGITEPPVANGLRIFSDDNRVFGLNIQLFVERGILVAGARNWLAGNYIGTDPTGRLGRGNGHGVILQGTLGFRGREENRIGTDGDGMDDEAERNVISGNSNFGVFIAESYSVVAGNYIGTDATGRARLPNAAEGIRIVGGAYHRIGTDGNGVADETECNIISGNGQDGVGLYRTVGNVVAGNYIGTDASGLIALSNGENGVIVSSAEPSFTSEDNIIGTDGDGVSDSAERNVIAGNTLSGVYIEHRSTFHNVVAGNYIGTDVTGTLPLSNGEHGVVITEGAHSNILGTDGDGMADAAERNIISGNALNGVHIEGMGTDFNNVSGNLIGTDMTGTLPLGNGVDGVRIIEFAANNRIGDVAVFRAFVGNVISANGNEGIRIQNGATNNSVQSNFIGTDASGRLPLGNQSDGVAIVEAPANSIGGGDGRNLISANALNGVAIQGSAATGNVVRGNLIGTDWSGEMPLGNRGYGVSINVASNNVIGDTHAAFRNVISANRAGVFIGSDVLGGESVGNHVRGNYIGVDITGRAPLANGLDGVDIFNRARNNVVDSNVVSGNREDGIVILGPDATANEVTRNFVGVDVTGSAAVGNGQSGVLITGSAHRNLVHDNVLSGNGVGGLDLFAGASHNTVTGNYVGLNAAGTAAIPNTYGVTVQFTADRNIIGTNADLVDDASEGNLISGNHAVGVLIAGGSHNVVAGNTIGLDAAGANPLPNNGPGVWIIPSAFGGVEVAAVGNRIGVGGLPVERNIISANGGDGVRISATHPELSLLIGARDNVVAGNSITMNAGHGVHIFASAESNRIGTDGVSVAADSVEGNLIAGNVLDGVRVVGVGTVRNTIRGNSIHSNGLLGIDLGGDGVTDNDARDPDTGPNQLQNYPVLAAAIAEGTGTRVRGTLQSLPNTSFTIDFYANAAADPSGHGEGQRWLGAITLTTNAGGTATFDHLLDISVEPGEFITATATDGPAANLGNTSEFSATRVVIKRGDRAPDSPIAAAPEENTTDAASANVRRAYPIDQPSVPAQATDQLMSWDHEAGLLARTLSLARRPALDRNTSALAADALFALLAADEEPAWIDNNPFGTRRVKFA